ncbi:MAG TPA: protoporphyrinogen oxidase, partial [Myxococcota bacterium]|nr:protoporphyrinogen oxidase [Myxococcota bacterium]
MSGAEVETAVVGAGAAGLAAALALRRAGVEVVLVEASRRPGGVMQTEEIRGHRVERGPNTCLVRAPALAFLREQGFEKELVAASPARRLRFVFHEGRLEPVPMGPLAFIRSPLLTTRGKLRLLGEPWVKRGDAKTESAAEFIARRFGPEVAEKLLAPALTGIYAGDERELGAHAVLGFATELERTHGSVTRGVLARAVGRGAGARGLRGTFSAREGFGGLAARLAGVLGERLLVGARVAALDWDGGALRLEVAGGSSAVLRARAVVLALPAAEAAALLRPLAPAAAETAAKVSYAPVVSVSVSVRPEEVRDPIEGFGFLVPRTSGLKLLGCLFMSSLFPDRAPQGRALLTCLLGGVRWPEAVNEPDDVLVSRLGKDLEATLGLRGGFDLLALSRWPRAVAQPSRRHGELVA